MRKTLLLAATILVNGFCYAQNSNSKDSLPSTDTSLQETKEIIAEDLPEISLNENDLSTSVSQNVSSPLTASRDPFLSQAAFNFSIERFKLRGYDADMTGISINGISMNNLDNGSASYSLWSGLNDEFRNVDISEGLSARNYSFGNIGGNINYDVRASKQRKQNIVSYSLGDATYTHRFSFTHNSGVNKNGWALAFSASGRWSDEGYVEGTFYHGASAFLSIDKKFNRNNILSFTGFVNASSQGLAAAEVQEMMNIAGTHYYNAYWGLQNGETRNSAVLTSAQPVFILSHELHISNNTTLNTSASYVFGTIEKTGLDWYNAPEPLPDYYGYLPSYQIGENQQQQVFQEMQQNVNLRQIDWQHLYDVNRNNFETIANANGISGNDVSGMRSLYIVSGRVAQTNKFSVNTFLNTSLSSHVTFSTGLNFTSQKNNYYEKVNDLLGGNFYVDLNQFAVRDFPDDNNAIQNNLNSPNRILHVGDQYGYDYDMNINKAIGWWQAVCKFNRFDFFAATQLSLEEFWRTGNTRYGLFPNDSYGKEETNYFGNYGAKAGFTYKLNGRNYLFANAAYLTKAPNIEDVYISPRTRDFEQDSLTSAQIKTFEAGYILNAPRIRIHLSGYYTTIKNAFDVQSFYDDQYDNFVNYALSHINKLYFGSEAGLQIKISPLFNFSAAASVGRYYYTSRQKAIVTLDNSAAVLDTQIVYVNNYRIPSTPQEAYSAGISYRSAKNLFINISGNYFTQNWLSFNPLRRTTQAVEDVDVNSKLYNDIIDEQKLSSEFTLNFYASYTWKLHKYSKSKNNPQLFISASINNLLNNQNIVSGGYEQLRFDYDNKDVNKFPPKYYYAYGLTYLLTASIRF